MLDDRAGRLSGRGRLTIPRWRVGLVGALAIVVAATAAGLDGSARPGAATAASAGANHMTGAWFCPHGGGPGWRGWVAIANPGPRTVRVRLTAFGAAGARALSTFDLLPETEQLREVAVTERGASTEVEYFGGWVGASSAVSQGTGAKAISASEACLAGPQRSWYLLDASTGVSESAYLVAMNPFAEAAEFDVSLFTEKRPNRPGPLTPLVVPPGRSVGIKLNDFVLLGQGESTLAFHVVPRLGRVLVGDVVIGAHGIRAEVGVPGPRSRWVAPSGGTSGAMQLILLNPGKLRSDLSAIAQGASAQQVVSGASDLSVPAGGVATFTLGDLSIAGLLVESTNQRPVLAAVRASGAHGGLATVAGSADQARRWLLVPAITPSSGAAVLALQNPERTDAILKFTWIGLSGVVAAQPESLTVGAGRTLQVAAPVVSGVSASAIITLTSGRVVPAQWTSAASGSQFAVVLGLPVPAGI